MKKAGEEIEKDLVEDQKVEANLAQSERGNHCTLGLQDW